MTNVDAPQAEKARRLFAGPCSFVLAASLPEHFDSLPEGLPEIAFWGRSNVGKSSLINALTGRKGLARASNTPGRTQQIVFFNLGGKVSLADLPGYGHAKASKEAVAQWTGLIKRYLSHRATLRCVLLLIDARRGLMPGDEERMALLDKHAVSYQIVVTKIDQLRPDERAALLAQTTAAVQKRPAARPDVFIVSSKKNEGLEALRLFLFDLAARR